MASPMFKMRLDDETRARWEGAAAGEALAAFVKRTVDNAIEEQSAPSDARRPPAPAPDFETKNPPPRPRRARATPCEHRVPPDSFCKRCD